MDRFKIPEFWEPWVPSADIRPPVEKEAETQSSKTLKLSGKTKRPRLSFESWGQERAAAAWKGLEQADLLPKDLRASIDKQILRVAATVK